MSQFTYTKKPDWNNDGAKARSLAGAELFASELGWIAPAAGIGAKAITSMTWGGGVVTVSCTGHGLVSGLAVLVANAVPASYNGLQVVTVSDANTFTFPLAVNPGTNTTPGEVYKSFEVVGACRQLLTKSGSLVDISVIPTFTAAVTYSGTLNTVTGDIITVTLTASEPVAVSGTPTIALTIAGVARTLTYDALTSTSTSLVFKYTVQAGDTAPNWSANHAYSIGNKYLHAGTWYNVTTGYTSGAVYDNLKVTGIVATLPSGSGFRVSGTEAITFTGGTQVVAATANATINASGQVSATAMVTDGEYSVAPTGITVANPSVAITAATWLTNVATITAANHGFLTGYSVVIAGVTPAGYNGTYTITVVDANTFTYALAVNPGGNGTVFGTATSVVVQPTITSITTAAIDTPNVSATTPQVVVGTGATGSVSDILPTGAQYPATVTFTAPDTTLATAN